MRRATKHYIGIGLESSGNLSNDKVMSTNFRLAEGGKSVKSGKRAAAVKTC